MKRILRFLVNLLWFVLLEPFVFVVGLIVFAPVYLTLRLVIFVKICWDASAAHEIGFAPNRRIWSSKIPKKAQPTEEDFERLAAAQAKRDRKAARRVFQRGKNE